MDTSISIIVPLFNEGDGPVELIAHLDKVAPGCEVVVVDASDDQESKVIANNLVGQASSTMVEVIQPQAGEVISDPAAGTFGFLTRADAYIKKQTDDLFDLSEAEQVFQRKQAFYGVELVPDTQRLALMNAMLHGMDCDVLLGDTLSPTGAGVPRSDVILANPPFGVEWKMSADFIKDEHERDGFAGRFGAGLPRINDGSFLFLQHMIAKMKRPEDGGSRVAIVFNGSPLFTGAAGSGESEIRRWIIEND